MKKCATSRQAWMLSIAAALDLFAFVLMAASSPRPVLLMIFGICEIVLILCAVGAWKQYFEFKLEELSKRLPASSDEEPQ